jgi:hypothetical protein
MQSENLLPDEHPLVQALDDFNGIPYRQFYGYDFAYETWGMEDIMNGFYLLFSYIYTAMPFYSMGILWKVFRKKIDLSELGFLRTISYIYFLGYNGPS